MVLTLGWMEGGGEAGRTEQREHGVNEAAGIYRRPCGTLCAQEVQ